MVTYSLFKHEYFNSFGYREPESEDYEVYLNNKKIPVYTCRISKIPFNRPWPNHQREINQTEFASYVNLVSDEEFELKVVVKRNFRNISIRPYSKDIKYIVQDNTVSFTVKNHGQYVLCCDDLHSPLYIFNSKAIECKIEDVTYYFGPGVHMPGKIELNDNESIYVHKDALVFGCILAKGRNNIKVIGNGVFDDSGEERFNTYCYEDFTNGNIRLYDCTNVNVEGVLFKNSAIWSVSVFHCFDVVINDIKVFGQWRYNTDGIDIVNSKNVLVKNSFIHSFDDSVTIKGIDRYIDTNCENIITENCVLWCDWGKTCEIGLETACREYKNIVFRNCDIIRCGNTALDVQNGDCAEVSDVLFENINVEYNSFDNFPVLQKNDECEYDAYDKKFVPNLVSIVNNRFRNEFYCNRICGIPPKHAYVNLDGINVACVHDIIIKNINVFYDEKIERTNGRYNIPIIINSCLDDVDFYNVSVSNVYVNGKKVSVDDVILDIRDVSNFSFDDKVLNV